MHHSMKLLALGALCLAATMAFAQSQGGPYTLTRSTIDGGGGTSSGGEFTLTGTIAQPDASTVPATGGQFSLVGGFWAGGDIPPRMDMLFRDGFEGP